MPEGPEVRKYAITLANDITQKTLTNVYVESGRYTKSLIPGIEYFENELPTKVLGVGVHGKFVYWILANNFFMFSTLGMTGRWTWSKTSHNRVGFKFADGSTLFFNDQRNFGTLKFVYGRKAIIQKLESLGPDMLAMDVDNATFIERLRKKNEWSIAKAIMNQSVIAGVGNYVKCDALWLANISPFRQVKSLTDDELVNMNDAIKKVLRDSYAKIDPDTDASSKFLVYGKKFDVCGNAVIKQKTDDRRTTHWVPAVQR